MVVTRFVSRFRSFAAEALPPRREPSPALPAASREATLAAPVLSHQRVPMMGRAHAARDSEGSVEVQAEGLLRESTELADCTITCQFRDGTLTLRGRVPRYSAKQAARSAVQGIPGVTAIDNRIDVIPVPVSDGPGGQRRSVPGVDRFGTD